MKTFTKFGTVTLLAVLSTGTAMAKDVYISATGSDSNDGLSSVTAVKTLARLNEIIENKDVVYVSGMINVSVEKPESAVEDNKWSEGGKWASSNSGKYQGFNISSRDNTQWQGITFIGEDPMADGFDGDEKTPLFIIRGKNNNGTKFKNIGFVNGISNENGGTVVFRDEAIVEFDNCYFYNNHPDWSKYNLDGNVWKAGSGASEKGGAIRTEGNCQVTFTNCLFENNINRQGGAIFLSGTAKDRTRSGFVSIKDCTFRGNTAQGCVDGDDEHFLDNSKGAAIAVYALNNEVYLDIDHCLFEDNGTWNEGGAVWIYDNTKYGHYCDVTIANSAFYGNRSFNNNGGALEISHTNSLFDDKDYVTTQKVKIINTTFSRNQAKNHGGAICFHGASTNTNYGDYPPTELWMVNCTVVGNYTEGNGGHCAGYKEMDNGDYGKIEYAVRHFYNCIFEGNIALHGGDKQEASDFDSSYLQGMDIANTYIGRLFIPNMAVEEYVEGIEAKNLVHSYSDTDFTEGSYDKLYIAGHQYAPNIYDYTRDNKIIVPFIPLPADSELKTAGNTQWLKMADFTVANPAKAGVEHPVAGYDISACDQLGFKRGNNTCAIGASEANVDDVMANYINDDNELPYKDNGGLSSISSTVITKGDMITRKGNEIMASDAVISIYTLSGTKVAENKNSVNIDGLTKGIYIVKANGVNGSSALKIVR